MSTLIVQLPAQPRLAAQQAEPATLGEPADVAFAFSADGSHVTRQGRAAVAELPQAQQVVAVLAPADVGWHHAMLPKAPASRMRQALAGVLEEALLEDESELHLALAPGASAGSLGWIAALNKPWLAGQLARLEASGLTVDRVVPAWVPEGPPAGHVYEDDKGLQLAWRDEQGPLCLPLDSPATRALLARQPADVSIAWSASPGGAAEAARLAGAPVASQSDTEFLQQAARSGWNLRQFDLAAQRRGQRAFNEALANALHDPSWRWVRGGLVLLLVLQLVGANVWAWQQRSALAQRKQAMNTLLQTTFPQVRGVIDAPLQMQKEIDLLRTASGKPGDGDLETLMYAAQASWPASRGPANGLQFENGRLTLESPGWSPQETEAFRNQLLAMGLDAETSANGPIVTRAKPGSRPPASAGGVTGATGTAGARPGGATGAAGGSPGLPPGAAPNAQRPAGVGESGPMQMRQPVGMLPQPGGKPAGPVMRPMGGPEPKPGDDEDEE